jgi:uncharacterized protein (TIGR02118 family)
MTNRRHFITSGALGLGAFTAASTALADADGGGERKAATATASLNVIYPARDGARFDMSYYRSSHIPLAMRVMQADRVLLIEGVPNGDKAPPYLMICHFEFASAAALQAAVAQPDMAKVRADVANFTDIKPDVMLGRS